MLILWRYCRCCFCDWRLVMRRWCGGRWRGARELDRNPTDGLGEGHWTQTLPAHQPVLLHITHTPIHNHGSNSQHSQSIITNYWDTFSCLPVSPLMFPRIVVLLFLLSVLRFIEYFWYLISPMSDTVSCVNMSACLCVSVLFCRVCIWTFLIPCQLLLLLTHALICLSPSLSFSLSLTLTLSHFPSLLPSLWDLPPSPLRSLFLCHCPLPSWSRFCRVGFPLSTRPCWTGAHAECFQFLPQIRNDLPMWIL